jgi:hypothetical protein
MMAEMKAALEIVNQKYDGNIKFKSLETKGKRISFTLTVNQTSIGKGKNKISGPGTRRGHSGQRIAAACWHVHGDYFDALFSVNTKAEVWASGSLANPLTGKWITIAGGNWQDWNIGSSYRPLKMSEACDCGMLRPTAEGNGFKSWSLDHNMIEKCPLYIFNPAHYKQDGSCLCFDKTTQDRKQLERLERREKLLARA